ncbi:MAG: rhomboid family intramembrane serine protease [Saprospiraceae bacterium]
MFRSIANDVRSSFDYGNMMVKLVIINVVIFMITAIIHAFAPTFYQSSILPYLALPGDLHTLMYRPWTLISHMFLHAGVWHLAWNMIIFYWFGNIAGDLLGDKRILPVYLIGGLVGALFYLTSFQFAAGIGGYALGASAAILAVVFTAVATAPDYSVSLILIGSVRIKFIGLFILFFDIIGAGSSDNSGGHIAHIGGALFGFLFVYLLRKGTDLSVIFSRENSMFTRRRKAKMKPPNTKLKVAHKADSLTIRQKENQSKTENLTDRVDVILEKIKRNGYDSLTDEEKDVLYKASKN